MTPDELRQCLDEAFGDVEPPNFDELGSFYPGEKFLDIVKMDTARTKRWQELRPLSEHVLGALDIILLSPKACQYYLPAYIYAMTDPKVLWCYLSPVVEVLWYENDYGDPRIDLLPYYLDKWERFAALLTDRQKRCIAHWLVEVLRTLNDPPVDLGAEVDWEDERIERMLKKYWNAWLGPPVS
jgi:hypothetical protein